MRTHGKRSSYTAGCRCGLCREAERHYKRRQRGSTLGREPLALQTWRDDAACAGMDPQIFYGPNPTGQHGRPRKHRTELAVSICHRCPVTDDCLAYALSHREDHGIWAGTTPEERGRMRRRIRRLRARPARLEETG